MDKPIRWGIMGTGGIAKTFATGLQALPDAQLVAVGSHAKDTAQAFGAAFKVPHCHASYEDLAADADVDAIYIATLNPGHRDNLLLCLEHGKAVLCEKPFTINAREAREAVALARRKKLFLMEAMWTRFLPLTVKVRELMAQKAIGEPRIFQANFGFDVGDRPQGRHLNHALGGGGLLDVGIYTLAYASMLFGQPKSVQSAAHIGPTGVDEQAAILLNYPGGQLAQLTCAVKTNLGQNATISGTKGRLRLEPTFWRGSKMVLCPAGQPEQPMDFPHPGNGYTCEAAEVMRCLRAGRLESDIMPLDETLQIMETMDEVRRQWGLKYPTE